MEKPVKCRICLRRIEEMDNFQNLLDPWKSPWSGMSTTISRDLANITNIRVTNNDCYSQVICNHCALQLQNACYFVYFAQRNDRKLRSNQLSIDDQPAVWPQPIQLDKTIDPNNELMDNLEIKQEVMSDESIEMPYITESRSIEIKVEPEEYTPDSIPITESESVPYSLTGPSESNGISEWLENESDQQLSQQTNVNSAMLFKVTIKEEPDEDEDTTVDLSLDCLLCAKTFKTLSGLKAHVVAEHSYKSVKRKSKYAQSPQKNSRKYEYVCQTCNRNFVTSTDLMVHATCHNKSTCYMCDEHFDTFQQLTSHRKKCKAVAANKKMLTDDVVRRTNEILRCLNCGLNVARMRRHTLELADVLTVIQQWITPRQASRDDVICNSCWLFARNEKVNPSKVNKRVGHRHVCVNCGLSLLRRRFHALIGKSERDKRIRKVIAEWILPNQLRNTDHVCQRCWRKSNRIIRAKSFLSKKLTSILSKGEDGPY